MSSETHDLISALFRTSSAVMVDIEPEAPPAGAERLLILANPTGTMQLCELVDGRLLELTALTESVSNAVYVPGSDPRRAVLSSAVGGNERDQLYLIDLDSAAANPVRHFDQLQALTADRAHGHHCAGVSPDGRLVAYTTNGANGIDFDLWVVDVDGGEHRLLWAGGGWCHPGSGFSPDGRLVSVIRSGHRPLDHDLVLIDVATGEAHWPLPHPDEPALIGAPVWIDNRSFYATSDAGRDFSALLRHDLDSGQTEVMAGTGISGDCEHLSLSAGAEVMVLTENRDCATPMSVYDPATGLGAPIPWAEPGLSCSYALPGPELSADGRRLYFTLTTPRHSAEVYRHDLDSGAMTRLTTSPTAIDPDVLAPAELHSIESFDAEPVQLFLYRPAAVVAVASNPTAASAAGRGVDPPVVVLVHGGPESQSTLQFNPIVQALAAAGFGVVVPNVRGSTGYGRRFAALDDTTRRLDSVADLAAVNEALGGLGFDRSRAALWGGSYGGYMVLAGVSMQPELWAAGVDIVGISNLVTFLTNTSAYRRTHREYEYGSLENDREFLLRASPMTHVDEIRAPLFIIHGRNDPRVPVTEAEQLAANLTERGVPCELAIYENEGHGLSRRENRLDAFPRAITFLERVMAGPSH